MAGTKTIETNRLILRKGTLNDAQDIFESYASREKVTEFLSWLPHLSVGDTKSYLSNVVLPSYDAGEYSWYVELKETHKVIGNISVVRFKVINDSVRCGELGWVLSDDYWGNGFMPEAATAVLDYLKDEGFVRVEARHNTLNPKSGRVMQKIGMKFEGILRKGGINNKGELVDTAIYSFIIGED